MQRSGLLYLLKTECYAVEHGQLTRAIAALHFLGSTNELYLSVAKGCETLAQEIEDQELKYHLSEQGELAPDARSIVDLGYHCEAKHGRCERRRVPVPRSNDSKSPHER